MKVLARVSPASRSRLAQKFSIVTRAVVLIYQNLFLHIQCRSPPRFYPGRCAWREAGGVNAVGSSHPGLFLRAASLTVPSKSKQRRGRNKKHNPTQKKAPNVGLLKTSRGHSNISAVKGSRLHHNDSQRRQIDLARHGFQSGPNFWW